MQNQKFVLVNWLIYSVRQGKNIKALIFEGHLMEGYHLSCGLVGYSCQEVGRKRPSGHIQLFVALQIGCKADPLISFSSLGQHLLLPLLSPLLQSLGLLCAYMFVYHSNHALGRRYTVSGLACHSCIKSTASGLACLSCIWQ